MGDAYIAVAGLPDRRSDHALAIANMALDMQHALSSSTNKTINRNSSQQEAELIENEKANKLYVNGEESAGGKE